MRAILYSVFNTTPPVTTLVILVGSTLVFAFVAVRYFRWEEGSCKAAAPIVWRDSRGATSSSTQERDR